MIMKKIILIVLSSIILFSCQGAKEALQGQKRSDTSDEFLVKKKNPLTMPPDYNELPVPLDQEEEEFNEESNSEIKKILEVSQNDDSNEESSSESNTTLEQSILEKIND